MSRRRHANAAVRKATALDAHLTGVSRVCIALCTVLVTVAPLQDCPLLVPNTSAVALAFTIGPCNPATGAFPVSFLPTISAVYRLSVHVNGSRVPQAIHHHPALSFASLHVLPGEVVRSAAAAGGESLVSAFSNWSNVVTVQVRRAKA